MHMLKLIMIILVSFMIAKDLRYVLYPQILRMIAQYLCLLSGLMILPASLSATSLRKYWPIWGYLITIFLSIYFSPDPLSVFLQSISLFSIMIFSIVYFEYMRNCHVESYSIIANTILICFTLSMMLSIALKYIAPHIAYEALFIDNLHGVESRFHGIYSKPGMLAAAAGILIGLGALAVKNNLLKILTIIPGIFCFLLSQARSFWIGCVVAFVSAVWIYFPTKKKLILMLSFVSFVMIICLALMIQTPVISKKAEKFARLESFSSFSGRFPLWNAAVIGFMESPFFGYGFTTGSAGIMSESSTRSNKVYFRSKDEETKEYNKEYYHLTLHNGYIQSLLDTGAIGTLFYVLTILLSIRNLIKYDGDLKYSGVFYVLIYLSVSNMGESVIFSGSVFHSILFWMFAALSLSLKPAPNTSEKYT